MNWQRIKCAVFGHDWRTDSGDKPSFREWCYGGVKCRCGRAIPTRFVPPMPECKPPKDERATLSMILAEMRTQTKIMQANSDTIHADSKRYADALAAHGKAT